MNGFDIRRLYSLIDKREQYPRNWCIRINNLYVPTHLIQQLGLTLAVMYTAYDRIIGPVLHRALQNWRGLDKLGINGVPALLDLIENGHFLGGKWNVQGTNIEGPRTIIIRFISRWWRNLFLKHKRHNMPKPTYQECTRYKVKYFFVTPDLTAMNYKYLMSLKKDSRIQSVWTQDGNFLFKLKSNVNKIWYVSDTLKTLDEIISMPQRPQNVAPPAPPRNTYNAPVSSSNATEPKPSTSAENVPCSSTAVPTIEPAKEPATEPVTKLIPNLTHAPLLPLTSNNQNIEPEKVKSANINTATSMPETATTSPCPPELGAKPKTRAQMCRKVGDVRMSPHRGKLKNINKNRKPDQRKEDAKAAIADLEAAFAEDTAEGDAAVTVDAFADTSAGSVQLNSIQLPTDEDFKLNKFLESNFSS